MKALRLLAFIGLLVGNHTANAHTSGTSFLNMRSMGNSIAAEFDFDLRDLHQQLQLDQDLDGTINWGEISAAQSAIEQLVLSNTQVSSGGRACNITQHRPIAIAEHGTGPYARVFLTLTCKASGVLQIDHTGWFSFDPGHRALLEFTNDAGTRTQAILSQSAPRWQAQESRGMQLQRFLVEGAVHLVTGYDHLAFLAVLLLALVRRKDVAPSLVQTLRRALGVITAFTSAHSVTLALAATGFLVLPSKPVEIAIAASVVIAALLNLWRHAGAHGWKLAFVFGLVHGLGFAGALAELTSEHIDLLALAAFNIGIEAAQIAIAGAAVPLIWWLFRNSRERIGVPIASIAVACVAAFWVVSRVAAT